MIVRASAKSGTNVIQRSTVIRATHPNTALLGAR